MNKNSSKKISRLDGEQQRRVLEFVETLEPKKQYSARELLKLPPEERERLVKSASALAAEEDFELFEAYRESVTGETRHTYRRRS